MTKPGDSFQMGDITVVVGCKHIVDLFPDGVFVPPGWVCGNCEEEKAMNEEKLAELDKLAQAATEPPWSPFPSGILHGPNWVISNAPEGERGRIMRDEDAAFVAAARSAVPELIAEVRRLRVEKQSVRDAALEEAAVLADREAADAAKNHSFREREEWLAEELAESIRALKEAPDLPIPGPLGPSK